MKPGATYRGAHRVNTLILCTHLPNTLSNYTPQTTHKSQCNNWGERYTPANTRFLKYLGEYKEVYVDYILMYIFFPETIHQALCF